MKRLLAVVVAGVILSSVPSYALIVGQMRSAETSGWGSLNLTTGVGLLETSNHIFGTARYGVASQIDVSGSVALVDAEGSSDPSLLLNADVQYQFMQSKLGWKLDMAGGIVFEWVKIGSGSVNVTTWSLGLTYIVSKPVKLNNGFAFTPYGRLNLRTDNYSVDSNTDELPGVLAVGADKLAQLQNAQADNSGDDSDFNIGINAGSVFPIGSKVSLIGEVLFDDEIGFYAGISFFMW